MAGNSRAGVVRVSSMVEGVSYKKSLKRKGGGYSHIFSP
jgi:hypothetical protein